MASSNAITLFSSVILGIAIYGEKLNGNEPYHKVFAFIGLAVALSGVSALGGSAAPATESSEGSPKPGSSSLSPARSNRLQPGSRG
jgi:hypothetical protein